MVTAPMVEVVKPPYWHAKPINIFLAGGISSCPDWQTELTELISNASLRYKCVLLNPRRDDFDINDKSMSERQIEWEDHMLNLADAHIFWFPKETLCPITLFELGKIAPRMKPLVVGCHPEYQRKFDVKKQLDLIRPVSHVVDSLEKIVQELHHM